MILLKSFGGVSVKFSQMETLLGVSIDSELNFENHISNICNKVRKKLNALGRIAGCITFEKLRHSRHLLNVNLIIAL